ncbi:MAG: amidohydrolase [Lachnospiraceae bacterium]|nr:amidohydrolase [Lachnospiraceae bacterium]
MNIRLYNARILTMEEGQDVFSGEVWVQDDRIVYIGSGAGPNEIYDGLPGRCIIWDREIDCMGNLLMPGFKNAHTHSGMTLLRSYADDLPLDEWLNHKIFPVEAGLTAEDIYELSKLAILEYLTSGVTAVFDMYLTPESIAQAFDDMGMRCVQVGAVNNFSQSPEMVEEMYRKLNHAGPLQSYIIGFHAEYTCSKELLEEIAKIAHKYKAPVFTHLAETEKEVAQCRERYGKTPMAFLDSLGMFDYGGGGYHCVHMTPEDITIMKEKGLYAVTNPGSNAKLASGIAPITDFLEAGVKVAIGTDGPASNNCLDMFREMFLVTGLAKLKEKDASAVDAMEVLKMATVNGAHAMGLKEADVLKTGKLADLIMIDLDQPNMRPLHNIPKNLVYSGSKQNVIMTMVGGKILYEKGEFHTKDKPKEIYQKTEDIIKRIMRK